MKTTFLFNFTLLLLLASACTTENQRDPDLIAHEISGRGFATPPIYRVKAPIDWQIKKPAEAENLNDTKKSICEFLIQKDLNEIRITIHNFPSKTIVERIPPAAQIIRWKRQFDELDPVSVVITPQSFAGFVGAYFEASGKINGIETTTFSWSMQIAPEHYRRLSGNLSMPTKDEEMRSCYTIKVVGPTDFMEKNRKAIIKFARSFELIDEIGYP